MNKPTFARVVRHTFEEIREVRRVMHCSQETFGRYFPVSGETIRSWESGRRNPYGPAAVRLQQLKEYTDHVTRERQEALAKVMGR